MTDDTKALLKAATINVVAILGYISTASTVLPIVAVARPYLLPLGIVLIILGSARGARSVIADRSKQRKRADFLECQRRENLRRSKG